MKTPLDAEPTVDREVERIRVLREGIGEEIDLLCVGGIITDRKHPRNYRLRPAGCNAFRLAVISCLKQSKTSARGRFMT
jgi:hypothetical protein